MCPQAMHHYLFILLMAFSIPSMSARKLRDQYGTLEKDLRDMDRDEEQERAALLEDAMQMLGGAERSDEVEVDVGKEPMLMLENNSHADAMALTNGSRGVGAANGTKRRADRAHDHESHEIEISSTPAGRNLTSEHHDDVSEEDVDLVKYSQRKDDDDAEHHGSEEEEIVLGRTGSNSADEDTSEDDMDEKDRKSENFSLPTRDIAKAEVHLLVKALASTRPLLVRPATIIIIIFITVVLCVLSTVYPAREMGYMVLLAPTINQASRRLYLARTIVFLSRELVLDDGLSRMHVLDISSFLDEAVREFVRVDKAIRFGHDLGIVEGADQHNHEHNLVMYADGCPWRGANATNCSTPLRPGVAAYGMNQLVATFVESARRILLKYGADPSEYITTHLHNPRTYDEINDEYYDELHVIPSHMRALTDDPDVAFMVSCFEEDLYMGLKMIVDVFNVELKHLIDIAISDYNLLFGIYVTILVGGFYLVVFRRNVSYAQAEARMSRVFMARIPIHLLSMPEKNSFSMLFDEGLLSSGKLRGILNKKISDDELVTQQNKSDQFSTSK